MAEFGRNHDLVPDGREGLADKLLVVERTVDLRGIEEGDAALHRGANEGDHVLPVTGRRAVALAHAHAAKAESRDLRIAVAKRARLHGTFYSFARYIESVPRAGARNQPTGIPPIPAGARRRIELHCLPAIDDEYGPGGEGGLIRAQVEDRSGDLLRPTHPPDRLLVDH